MVYNVRVAIPATDARMREVLAGCGYPLNSELTGLLGVHDGIAFYAVENLSTGDFDACISKLNEGQYEAGCDFASGTEWVHTPFDLLGADIHRNPALKNSRVRQRLDRLKRAITAYLQAERVVMVYYTFPRKSFPLVLPQDRVVRQTSRGGTLRLPFTELTHWIINLLNAGAHCTIEPSIPVVGRYRLS